jgi:fatty-acyl-CoA synthase
LLATANDVAVWVLTTDCPRGSHRIYWPTPVAFVEYETGEPVRDKKGRLYKVGGGEPGLLLSKVSSIQPFEGYTDAEATEKKLVRNGFRDGDVWLNTGT